jgi:hypothetical protein
VCNNSVCFWLWLLAENRRGAGDVAGRVSGKTLEMELLTTTRFAASLFTHQKTPPEHQYIANQIVTMVKSLHRSLEAKLASIQGTLWCTV